VEIWEKCLDTFEKSLRMVWFYKKVQTSFLLEVMFLFSSFRASEGKFEQVWGIFGQKWCLKGFDFKKYAQHENKCSRFFILIYFFWGHFLWSIFRASLWKFGQNFFAPPNICLLLHPCSDWLATLVCYFSGVFICYLWLLLIVRVKVASCRVTL